MTIRANVIALAILMVGVAPRPSQKKEGAMQVHVGGDGTYLALVDTARYASFVNGGDWNGHLNRHLVEQSRALRIVPWDTGFDSDWLLELHAGITKRHGIREFEAGIRCTSGTLHLVNFDSLTMAAQFADHTLPDEETRGTSLAIEPGLYRVRVVQLVNPKSKWWENGGSERPQFLLEYEPAVGAPSLSSVPWASSDL